MLAPMIVLVAACLPRPSTPALPASFLDEFGGSGRPTFTALAPPIGETGQSAVEALRAEASTPMFRTRAVPMYGVIDCTGVPDCQPGPARGLGEPIRAVWVIIYPDWFGAPGEIGWALVDAHAGPDAGYEYTEP